MRLEHEHRTRPSNTNSGSPQHAADSPSHVNGSVKSETNGFHPNGDGAAVARNTQPYCGHNREEMTRVLLQSLSDMGYTNAAQQLSRDSGYELEIPSVAAFRTAVQQGEWDEAEALLFGSAAADQAADGGGVSLGNGFSTSPNSHRRRDRLNDGKHTSNGLSRRTAGLPLADGADTVMLKFVLREQKYLELLEARDLAIALGVLRNELTPLRRDTNRVHFLSSLMMCPTSQDLRRQADWDGAGGQSRNFVLSEISRSISPSVMIPENRLATLLSSVQQEQIINCRFHNTTIQPSLYTDHECSPDDFPLQQYTQLSNHIDEVWHLAFSNEGTMLATAGADGLVTIYSTQTWQVLHELREHEPPPSGATGTVNQGSQGVCHVAWSPNDRYLISCGRNNSFVVVNTDTGLRVAVGDHFEYHPTAAAWLPDSQTFVVGSQSSRRPLGLYSIRNSGTATGVSKNNEIHSWREPPWDPNNRDDPRSFRISNCTVSRDGMRLAAASHENNKIFIYELPSRLKIAEWQMEDKVTNLTFDSNREELLVSMKGGRLVTLDATTGERMMTYTGLRSDNFVIRSAFGGAGENFVVSGSEGEITSCSRRQLSELTTWVRTLTDPEILIWRRQTGQQIALLEGHSVGSVNAVAWHPKNPAILASCGDDRKVRIWASANYIHAQNGSPAGPGVLSTFAR